MQRAAADGPDNRGAAEGLAAEFTERLAIPSAKVEALQARLPLVVGKGLHAPREVDKLPIQRVTACGRWWYGCALFVRAGDDHARRSFPAEAPAAGKVSESASAESAASSQSSSSDRESGS